MSARRFVSGCLIGVMTVAGCGGPSTESPSTASQPIGSAGASPSDAAEEQGVVLPDADALVPSGAAGATDWIPLGDLPAEFDADAVHPSTSDLADAFGAALFEARIANPERPDLDLETFTESENRVVLIVSETGIGDDSVLGTQYALVAMQGVGGWTLDEAWMRALCRRGVDREAALCV